MALYLNYDVAGCWNAVICKNFSATADSTTNHSFNINTELGVATNGYVQVRISATGYGSGGSNGLIFEAITGGYSGHSGELGYHRRNITTNEVANGSCDIYNPSASVYGIAVENTYASEAIEGMLTLNVTWR
jgi:hypothetical protein